MPSVLFYLLKLSISLAVVYLFYRLVLRKMTFYTWNRWYLLGYSLLSFIVPFIDIAPVLGKTNLAGSSVINWVPLLSQQQTGTGTLDNTTGSFITVWQLLVILFAAGMLVSSLRFLMQFISYRRLLSRSVCIAQGDINIYQVNDDIVPFSFGKSVFINQHLHSPAELDEIIRHEFVHIRQRHSIDIIWGELLCLVNWFNPFAWLIRRSIRQNLEFIADKKVLDNGIDKKAYQYLLLKVTGGNHYSIATPFNFSSLKKRIAMMNKIKTARVHLVKFMFALPLAAVLLLAFRNKWNAPERKQADNSKVYIAGLVVDAITMEPLANATLRVKEKNLSVQTDSKGYYLLALPVENKPLSFTVQINKAGYSQFTQSENWGNFAEGEVYNRFGKTISYFGLSHDGQANHSFSTLAGNGAPLNDISYESVMQKLDQLRKQIPGKEVGTDTLPEAEIPVHVNDKGFNISVYNLSDGGTVLVKDKNNKEIKRVPLSEWNKKANYYEKLYGALPPPPPPSPAPAVIAVVGFPMPAPPAPVVVMGEKLPAPPAEPAVAEIQNIPLPATAPKPAVVVLDMPAAPPAPAIPVKLPADVKSITIEGERAEVKFKNGKTEVYNFSNPDEKKKFEDKYGRMPELQAPPATRAGTVNEEKYVVVSDVKKDKDQSVKPLYIVDGKKISAADIDKIDMTNLNSVSVLKDKSATDKYGEEGRNGVIEIVTKPAAKETKPAVPVRNL